MFRPTNEQSAKMELADKEIALIISRLDRDNIRVLPKLLREASGYHLYSSIAAIVRPALEKSMISEYESFQLYEVYDRLYNTDSDCCDWRHSLVSFNMAMMAKLFGEEDMYGAFCKDAEERYDGMIKMIKGLNSGKLPKPRKGDEFYYGFREFLQADKEHLEYLRDLRSQFTAFAKVNGHDCFFNCYPWHLFRYDDELLRTAECGTRYHVCKKMSPVVCDIIAAAEISDYELRKGCF